MRRFRKIQTWVAIGVLVFSHTWQASACMMVPKDFEGRISQNRHQAILVHHGDQEELILRINYKISGGKTPLQFAWIITTPTEPSAYHLADPKIFDETSLWANRLIRPPRKSRGSRSRLGGLTDDKRPQAALEFGKREVVGPYDIQPVRARGRDALDALNQWLTANGFPTEDPGHMKYFIDEEFTFLCVKINSAEGADGVASSALLPPLHLTFETENPYYPLLFSSRQGVFDLELTTLTDQSLDYGGSYHALTKQLRWSAPRYKKNVPVRANQLPKSLAAALKKSKNAGKRANWKLNVIRGSKLNGEPYAIAGWKSDVFLAKNSEQSTPRRSLLPWTLLLVLGGWALRRKLRIRRVGNASA